MLQAGRGGRPPRRRARALLRRARSRTGTATRAGSTCCLLEGRGRFGLPDGEHELAPGDFVDAPAGERHFHGAAAGADCVWLAITWGVTDWEDRAPERRMSDDADVIVAGAGLRRPARRPRPRRRGALGARARGARPPGRPRPWTRPVRGLGPARSRSAARGMRPSTPRCAPSSRATGSQAAPTVAPAAVRWRTGGELRDGLPVPFERARRAQRGARRDRRRRCCAPPPGRSPRAARSRVPSTCGSWAPRGHARVPRAWWVMIGGTDPERGAVVDAARRDRRPRRPDADC